MKVKLNVFSNTKWNEKGIPYSYSLNLLGTPKLILNVNKDEDICVIINPWSEYDRGFMVSTNN